MKIDFTYDIKKVDPIIANCFACIFEAFTDEMLESGDGEFCNEIFPISVQRIEDKKMGEEGLLIDVLLHKDYIEVYPNLELIWKDGKPLSTCVVYTILYNNNFTEIQYAQRYWASYRGFGMLPIRYNDLIHVRHIFHVISRAKINNAEIIVEKFNKSINTKEDSDKTD